MINIFTGWLALKNLQLSLLWKFDGSCILFSSFLVCIFLCFITIALIELIVLYGLYDIKDFDIDIPSTYWENWKLLGTNQEFHDSPELLLNCSRVVLRMRLLD
jgi:hypothetical protein